MNTYTSLKKTKTKHYNIMYVIYVEVLLESLYTYILKYTRNNNNYY